MYAAEAKVCTQKAVEQLKTCYTSGDQLVFFENYVLAFSLIHRMKKAINNDFVRIAQIHAKPRKY